MRPAPRYLLLLSLLACTATDWQPFAVDRQVSVQLPAQPAEIDLAKAAPGRNLNRSRMWLVRTADGAYQVVRIPSTYTYSRADTAGRRAFYAGVLTAALRNENGQLLALTPFPTPVGAGVEFKYRGLNRGTGRRVIKYGRCLLVDSVSYALNFLPADVKDSTGTAGAEQRRRFFNFLTVKL